MGKLTVEPVKVWHLMAIEPREDEPPMHHHIDLEHNAQALVRSPGYTILEDDFPIACVGIFEVWKGVGEAWFYAGIRMEKYPKFTYKVVRQTVDAVSEHLKLHRVSTAVDERFPKGKRFLEHMGFELEGAMPKYGPDEETYLRYAYFPKGHWK